MLLLFIVFFRRRWSFGGLLFANQIKDLGKQGAFRLAPLEILRYSLIVECYILVVWRQGNTCSHSEHSS
jgi:hypothetical protein